MCGLAGFIGVGDDSDIKKMSSKLIHRGPDKLGYYRDVSESLFFAHSRLSIIDLSDKSSQPMVNDSKDLTVIFNGEIYNFLELREQLQRKGYKFKSNSDTEVLIHGYQEWGSQLPQFLNGMFAFVIYDKKNKKLFLCRDRFGEKPLYYFFDGKNFAFSSELSSLTQYSKIDLQHSSLALKKYFAYGYIPAPLTLYEKCYKLPPGNSAIFDLDSKKFASEPYWRFEINNEYSGRSESDLLEELDFLLKRSVKSRLNADVDLGLFLSGGLDSSTVLAYASEILDKDQIKTFTIGFNESSFDESRYAAQVADFFGVKNFTKTLSHQEVWNISAKVLAGLDEPIADSSILPTYSLAEFAKKHVTVALSGDGGDEMFAGYDPFDALRIADFYDKVMPKFLHKKLITISDLLPKSSGQNMPFSFKVKRALTGLSYEKNLWNPVWLSPLNPDQINDLVNEPIRADDLYSEAIEIWDRGRDKNMIDKTIEFYTNLYLPGSVLAKVDRATMMNSLESRAVFLDKDLADFCMKLPSGFKFRNGQKKYLLKKLMEKKLPKNIVERKKKGFGVPVSKWLTDSSIETPKVSIEGLDQKFADSLWMDHKNKKSDNRLFVWSWFILQKFSKSKSEIQS